MIANRTNNRYVKFTPENAKDKKVLHSFPGLLLIGLEYFCANKPHVITNVVHRLKAKNITITADQHVKDSVHGTFKLREIPEDFKFYTTPLKHQLIALRFAYTLGSCGLLLEAGMGKTKVVLDYIALMGFKKSVIVCPKALLFVWMDEQQTHRPDLSIYCIETTDWSVELDKVLAADVVVVNYSKATILEEQLKDIPWDYINVDEFLIKDPTTERTKSITRLGTGIEYKTGGSGTLVNNTPMDVFAPVRFLEPSLVGYSFAKFKDEYCVTRKTKPEAEQPELKFVVGFRKPDEIRSILHCCSIIMTKQEWLKDLPGKTFNNVIVQMSDEQRGHFLDLASNYVTEVNGEFVEVDNPLTVLCKLLQIANGFLYISPPGSKEDPEEMEWLTGREPKAKRKAVPRKVHFFQEQPKAEKLVDLLTHTFPERRVIVWYNLSGERTIIEEYLTEASIPYLVIAGGEKDTGAKVRTFNTTQTYRVLLCQAKAVNYGITVLGTNMDQLESDGYQILPSIDPGVYTQIFYSRSFSLETYLQQQDRIHRIGQTHACEYYHLISNSSIEYEIVTALDLKSELSKTMLVDIAKQGRLLEEIHSD